MIDERTELLITRRLDGEISPEESLELDKALIRSPESRRLLEVYAQQDAAAAAALKSAIERPVRPASLMLRRAGVGHLRGRLTWLGVAAALALLVVPWAHRPSAPNAGGDWMGDADPVPLTSVVWPVDTVDWFESPRRENHRVLRDVLGIVDPETNNVYLLEMDRQQTTVTADAMNF